jgi:plastocyanin
MYVPHVQWVRTDTQMVVANSDQADHNIHGYKGSLANTQFNFASAPGTKLEDIGDAYLERAGKYLVKCDIHPWMSAYIHVVSHPYHDVTSEKPAEGRKAGEYVLSDVPPGEYELVCWHEGMDEKEIVKDGLISAYVYSDDHEQTAKVKVEPGKTAAHDFTVPAPSRR